MNYPFVISDYPEKLKQYINLAIKIIDNEGDPDWCFQNNKLTYCTKDAYNAIVFEYKRRVMIQLNDLFKKKTTTQIRKFIKPQFDISIGMGHQLQVLKFLYQLENTCLKNIKTQRKSISDFQGFFAKVPLRMSFKRYNFFLFDSY